MTAPIERLRAVTRLERLRADLAEWVRVRPKWRHIPTRTDDLAALLAVADAARAFGAGACPTPVHGWCDPPSPCGGCPACRLAAALAALDGAAEEG